MFLLGSGVSIPAGFPSTDEITSQVFGGSNIIRHTDGRYYLAVDSYDLGGRLTTEYLSKVLELLRSIRDLMESYKKGEPLNYEILYYFIQQLNAYESGELLNMALFPFIRSI